MIHDDVKHALTHYLPNMKLRAIISIRRLTVKQLSMDLGYEKSYLTRVCTGYRRVNDATVHELGFALKLPIKPTVYDQAAAYTVKKVIDLLTDYELELLKAALNSNVVRKGAIA